MLKRLLCLTLSVGPVLAQSNAVPGLDIRMYDLTDLGYNGRRGVAPNSEAGFSVGHSWCNTGTVDLPWMSQSGGVMVDRYPRITFLLARENGGRFVQVCGRSYCKHSPVAFNFSSGPCAPCTASGGSFFYVGCSDTYGSGTNASQSNLGPTDEIDPWLGTWNPTGSYFDRGDPPVAGAAAVDSVKSLSTIGFDSVKNRITVRESELIAGSNYYAQVYACVQGEPVAARGNNAASRQVSITSNGSGWSTSTVGPSVVGPLVASWPGATSNVAGNGNFDGRFAVAVKVTGPVAGMWHYEYAIQNLDNNRGGASFRIPVDPTGVVQNAGFRDIDTDPLNDWTFARTSNEISFTASGTNSLDWNTIYNCWFDCSIGPGAGSMTIDEARPGAGPTSVQVPADSPSGLGYAQRFAVGSSCGTCQGSFYELFPVSSSFDLGGRSMTLTPNASGDAYTVTNSAVPFVPAAGTNLGLLVNTQTTVALPFTLQYPGGSTTSLQVKPCGYVTAQSSPVQLLPTATALLTGGPRWAAAWTLLQPLAGSANVFYDATPSRAIVTWNAMPMVGGTAPSTFQLQFLPNGVVHAVWQNVAASNFAVMAGWSAGSGHSDPGSIDLSSALASPLQLCGPSFDGLSLAADANPVLGTTLNWQVGGIPAGTTAGLLFRSLQLATPPIDLTAAGMPGCFQYLVAPEAAFFTSSGATALVSQFVPNSTVLVGVSLVGQSAIFLPQLTPLGFVASNGYVLTVGL